MNDEKKGMTDGEVEMAIMAALARCSASEDCSMCPLYAVSNDESCPRHIADMARHPEAYELQRDGRRIVVQRVGEAGEDVPALIAAYEAVGEVVDETASHCRTDASEAFVEMFRHGARAMLSVASGFDAGEVSRAELSMGLARITRAVSEDEE
ncbi:hypothetical protein DMP07_04470 [Slackia faecicanis]|uniref:Uncharacterized protein n=1 Tax=Slackia faecicanis TaxID=255723 RepID=A0A3N0AGB4_9ACTN|nr:hypothetical protein [Slackia faecicanis]RNL20838.1 hypothetical protein DMP07_04470 [Slackia faecicanis]